MRRINAEFIRDIPSHPSKSAVSSIPISPVSI